MITIIDKRIEEVKMFREDINEFHLMMLRESKQYNQKKRRQKRLIGAIISTLVLVGIIFAL